MFLKDLLKAPISSLYSLKGNIVAYIPFKGACGQNCACNQLVVHGVEGLAPALSGVLQGRFCSRHYKALKGLIRPLGAL